MANIAAVIIYACTVHFAPVQGREAVLKTNIASIMDVPTRCLVPAPAKAIVPQIIIAITDYARMVRIARVRVQVPVIPIPIARIIYASLGIAWALAKAIVLQGTFAMAMVNVRGHMR